MVRSRWAMVIVAVCLVVTVAAIAYAVGKTSGPEVIRTQRLELIDSTGNTRAYLGVDERGATVLVLLDEAGRECLRDSNKTLSVGS